LSYSGFSIIFQDFLEKATVFHNLDKMLKKRKNVIYGLAEFLGLQIYNVFDINEIAVSNIHWHRGKEE